MPDRDMDMARAHFLPLAKEVQMIASPIMSVFPAQYFLCTPEATVTSRDHPHSTVWKPGVRQKCLCLTPPGQFVAEADLMSQPCSHEASGITPAASA